jgi:hypothetical protein
VPRYALRWITACILTLGHVMPGGQSPALPIGVIYVQHFENGRSTQPPHPFRDGGRVKADSKIQMRSSMISISGRAVEDIPRAARQSTTSQYAGTQSLYSHPFSQDHQKFAIKFNASFRRGVKLLVDTLIRALLTYSNVLGFADRTGSRCHRTLINDEPSWPSGLGCDADPE